MIAGFVTLMLVVLGGSIGYYVIGDGRSTYHDGIVSRVNATAARCGARAGSSARAFVDCIAASLGANARQ